MPLHSYRIRFAGRLSSSHQTGALARANSHHRPQLRQHERYGTGTRNAVDVNFRRSAGQIVKVYPRYPGGDDACCSFRRMLRLWIMSLCEQHKRNSARLAELANFGYRDPNFNTARLKYHIILPITE